MEADKRAAEDDSDENGEEDSQLYLGEKTVFLDKGEITGVFRCTRIQFGHRL